MTKEILLADLRNKLSPIKNYLSLQRLLESQLASSDKTFIDGMKQVKLEEAIKTEKIKAEGCMTQVELLIEQLENI